MKLIEKFVDPYGSYGPYELKMASRIVKFRVQVLTFGSLTQHGVLHKQYVILVEDNFSIANCWRWIFSYEKRM